MSPKFTKHGKDRAVERGITPEEIDNILFDLDIVTLPSNTDNEVAIALGKATNGKLWAIVFNLETGEVITVRRAAKKERRFYEQQKGN